MDPHSGFTCPNLLEADTDRALIEAGRRLVVVADHSKWGVIGISSIARLDQADVLITDAGLEPEARATLEAAGPPAHRRRPGRPTTALRRPCRLTAASTGTASLPEGLARRPASSLQPAHRRVGPRVRRADRAGRGSAPRSRRPATTGRPTSPTATCARATSGPTATATRPTTRPSCSTTTSPRCAPTPRWRRSTTACCAPRASAATCRVVCFSPRHDLTLGAHARRPTWAGSSTSGPTRPRSSARDYRWVQVFENRGAAMGASNPHPHGQIWAGTALPGRGRPRGGQPGRPPRGDGPAAAPRLRRPGAGRAAGRGRERRVAGGRPVLGRLAVRDAGHPDADRPRACRTSIARPATGWRPRSSTCSAATTRCSAARSRTRWAGTRRRSAPATRDRAGRSTPTSTRRCCAATCASSWSATSCSPRPSAT